MKYLFCILSVIFLLISCTDDKSQEIKPTLSEDVMASIMSDMTRADYMLMISDRDSAETEKMRRDYRQSICRHYNTTVETYESDLQIYLQDEKRMKNIFDKAKRK
ncbi:MAG: DUF4296 domain-containing protein [Bacteroidales bacterium]|nr:DUF4296 domain-containing protein [Bacteroidales bacterium]